MNNTLSLCQHLVRYYDKHTGPVIFYGDPSGANRSTSTQDTDFGIIATQLSVMGAQCSRDLRKAAPGVAQRGQLINAILSGEFGGLAIRIDPACTITRRDLREVRQQQDGTKSKPRRANEHGLVCELVGHTSDAMDYLVCTLAAEERRQLSGAKKPLGAVAFGR